MNINIYIMPIKPEDAYKCYIHEFSGTVAEGRKHQDEGSHSYSGSQKCYDCGGESVCHDYEGVLDESVYPQTPTRCDNCLTRLAKELKEKGKI